MVWTKLPNRATPAWEACDTADKRVHVVFDPVGRGGWSLLLGWKLPPDGYRLDNHTHLNLFDAADEAEAFRRAEQIVAVLGL